MYEVDALALDRAAKHERRDEPRFGTRPDLDDAEAGAARAHRERVARAYGKQAFMAAAGELVREQQRLTLAAAPTAFGIHLENSQRHGTTSSAAARSRKTYEAPSRILIVALANLGDLVFASSLTPPLAQAFPDATIDLWCKRYTAAVGALVPHVRTVIAADPFWAVAPGHPRPAIGPILRSIGAARRNRYDLALITDAPWRTAAAVAAAGIPRRIGLARHRNSLFLTEVLAAEDVHAPVVGELARLAAAAGARSENAHYALDRKRLTADDRAAVSELPAQFVALHPFASTRARCVPLDRWTQLAFALNARGIPVLWIGRAPELGELRRAATHPRGFYVDQFRGGTLGATAAALSRASAFVGHDSGPLHVAAAFGVPVVGVFAPGQPDRTFPQGPGPWRMISRTSPEGIDASTMLHELDALQPITSPR
jgi:ADP-heptose:LPS heptosyltransferase